MNSDQMSESHVIVDRTRGCMSITVSVEREIKANTIQNRSSVGVGYFSSHWMDWSELLIRQKKSWSNPAQDTPRDLF